MGQKTIQLTNDWQSLNVLTGASVGAQIDVQVIHGRDVRVATSDEKPTIDVHGFSFEAGEFYRSESGAKEAWVRAAMFSDAALLEVQF